MALYVGLISGTSMDAVDAALLEISGTTFHSRHTHALPLPDDLHDSLSACLRNAQTTFPALLELDARLGRLFAQTALELLAAAGIPPTQVRAIGSHGQTVYHQPDGLLRSSLQLGDPNLIAELTGITTVADFRRRDMAAGGQGAPLVPAFHHAAFAHTQETRVVLNLGGIANITVLDPAHPVIGFDTGPANGLMDAWIEAQRGARFDTAGDWAASGSICAGLLKQWLTDPYFALPAPKSTGREYFNLAWLEASLRHAENLAPQDVQATLCELTAVSVAQAVLRTAATARRLLVCGGGTRNVYLMSRLRHHLPGCDITSTAAYGLDPDYVEAAAFAWLAQRTLDHLPGNLPSVTGARHAVVLGGIYPASLA